MWERRGGEISQLIQKHALKTPKTSNKLLFELAKQIQGLEMRRGTKFGGIGLHRICSEWSRLSKPYLTEGKDYFEDFLVKYSAVKSPAGVTLAAALQEAAEQEPPEKVLVHSNPNVHLLACLCRVLQTQAGDKPFFLAGRACAETLG